MNWWCAATFEPWSWSFRAYPGIWAVTLALLGGYLWACRSRRQRDLPGPGPGRVACYVGGVIAFWVVTDWPLGPLGAGYLASVHMGQFQVYTLVVAPLLLVGLGEDLFRSLTRRLRLDGVLPHLARPLVAGVTFNVALIATHSPIVVDNLRTSQFGSFALDVIWIVAGFVLWLPVASPARELRASSPAVQCVYLFLAAGALAMLPGALLTFASYPLYRVYELAPRVTGLTAADDQQVAGIVMKIGNLPIIWAVMLGIFIRWAEGERRADRTGPAAEAGGEAEVEDRPAAATPAAG